MTLSKDQVAGILVCAGGVLGFVGSYPTGLTTIFTILEAPSFLLITIFGYVVFRARQEGRIVAGATIWFAALAGAAAFITTIFAWWAFFGVAGGALAVAGAVIKLLSPRNAAEKAS